jgi:hypothetical protein
MNDNWDLVELTLDQLCKCWQYDKDSFHTETSGEVVLRLKCVIYRPANSGAAVVIAFCRSRKHFISGIFPATTTSRDIVATLQGYAPLPNNIIVTPRKLFLFRSLPKKFKEFHHTVEQYRRCLQNHAYEKSLHEMLPNTINDILLNGKK